MLLDTLGASLLGNILAGKGIMREKTRLEPVKVQLERTRVFNATSSLN